MLILPNIYGALEQIWANKMRSLLTILGIVIAVASTIMVVSSMQGYTVSVATTLQGLGTNAVWVWPDRPPGETGRRLSRVEMDLLDVAAVDRSCPALRAVSPLLHHPGARISRGSNGASADLEGVAANYHVIRNFDVEVGRRFTALDVERAHHVCVVGRGVVRKLKAGEGLVGETLLIENGRFRVIGILQEKGGLQGSARDDVVLVPFTRALRMYPESRTTLAFIAQAASEAAVPEARAQIVSLLRRRHGLADHQPNDFSISTQDEILSSFNNLSLVAMIVLTGVVGVSLLVGGIGIMNVMLVSVTERTREIGLRMAVGARRRDILLQFLTEAVALSLLGGIVGIALGYSLCSLASLHPRMAGIAVPWWTSALGFCISAGTGVLFGLLPALKAALLNPIDALRHE
jgi:putative ABC transport system permease protein